MGAVWLEDPSFRTLTVGTRLILLGNVSIRHLNSRCHRSSGPLTHPVRVVDVLVGGRRHVLQRAVIGRVVREAHQVIGGLGVARRQGERAGAVLSGCLEVALLLHLPPHGGVPVVLDGVVGPGCTKHRASQQPLHTHTRTHTHTHTHTHTCSIAI